MSTATLRSIGGSIVLSIPKKLLELIHLSTGSKVDITVKDGNLIVQPIKPKYSLEELMAKCTINAPMNQEEKEWIDNPSLGEEIY
jgi:antitoxin ChpS